MKKILYLISRLLFFACFAVILSFLISRLLVVNFAHRQTYTADSAPTAKVAIVFGAGLSRSGQPSPVLQDRVKTAADLYFKGKVQKLLMSGDNRFLDYNEPGAMRSFALKLGVPDEDIIQDYAGRRTYDTCYRARHIFDVEEAILVTQEFHLSRAMFTCSTLGVKSIGVLADQRTYSRHANTYWELREIPATFIAVWEVWVSRPLPVLGSPEPIFPTNNQG